MDKAIAKPILILAFMVNYRRHRIPGGCYFFTVALANRQQGSLDAAAKSGLHPVMGTLLRDGKMRELIQSDPSIMMGKPVIAGTCITVELILEKLAAGETMEQILEAHPRLRREAIQAALAFAASALRTDVVYPVRQTGA
jgi:uncharacterized protein (DUF433 family)